MERGKHLFGLHNLAHETHIKRNIKYLQIIYKKVLTQFQARNNIATSTTQTEIQMLDNLTIVVLGAIVVCAIFVVAGAIAEWKGWK